MQDRRQNRRPIIYYGWRKVAYSWPTVIILFIITFFILRATWRIYGVWDRSRANSREASSRYEANLRRSQELETEVSRLGTERGLEEELRRNFPIVKPGEEVVIILGDKATSTR